MRVLISGTRNGSAEIEDKVFMTIEELLERDEPDLFLILGDANGVDQYTRNWAELNKVDHCIKYAHWNIEGKSSGIKRNLRMFDEVPDFVIAFPSKDSKGTRHVIAMADELGIHCEVHEV